MNKELLNKILPYCGYGLKVLENQCVRNVVGIYYDKFDYEQGYSSRENGDIGLAKPILFPTDCLTQEIETEYGKEVPLIELAKIVIPIATQYGRKWMISGRCAENYPYYVIWEKGFTVVWKKVGTRINSTYMVGYLNVFQFLYSRHIAFDLEPNEYINVGALENNPYASSKIIKKGAI